MINFVEIVPKARNVVSCLLLRTELMQNPWLNTIKTCDDGKKKKKQYTKDCTGVIVTQEHDCDAYLSAMDQGERTLDFSQSMVPAYHAIGESASQRSLSLLRRHHRL